MARKLIDISVPLQNDVPADPPGGHPTIQYIDHQQGLPRMLQFFEGLKAEDLPDGQGWAVEQVQLSTHNGTHLDAPWHFHPTMNRGERSWTIDEVPLEWCLQPGVKLDFRHFPDGYVATAGDVEAELKRIGHTLSPLEIVVVNTSAGIKYGRQDYVTSGCGMGYEATMYLLERGVRLTGIDGWSWGPSGRSLANPSGRGFMLGAGALALTTGAGNSRATAQTADTKPFRIDVHHHLSPPTYVTASNDSGFGDPLMKNWTIEKSLADMDKAGIATAMLSVTTPAVNFTKGDAARKLCRESNEYGAKLIAEYPGRFGNFAMLPLTDAEGSLRELTYRSEERRVGKECRSRWSPYH